MSGDGRHPIIYVRGFAATEAAQDETTADPFNGFNIGSTVYRATTDRSKTRKFIFESPVLRLISDYNYLDVFRDGWDIMDDDWNGGIPYRSIVIYRYYEPGSSLLGSGETPEITEFAQGLSDLILAVKKLVHDGQDPPQPIAPDKFKCYLVAHSMGGLICRAFLQNPKLGSDEARGCVDKVFTYASPHNGIDMAGLNVPHWLGKWDVNNFSKKKMAEYLNLKGVQDALRKSGQDDKAGRVDWLPEDRFPSERFFCMVGTNRMDYAWASRTFSGHGGDGLVKIANASVWGIDKEGRQSSPCATAYAFRSHSGYFGIVNGEETYQNLTRFLFGDIRVDIWVDVESVTLPPDLQKEEARVDALYQFEFLAAPRGKRWYLTRRTAEEDSVACRTHSELKGAAAASRGSIFLSTVFLSQAARVNKDSPELAYTVTLGVRVPDYELNKRLWPDEHFEGGYLFRDEMHVRLTPPQSQGSKWQVDASWKGNEKPDTSLSVDSSDFVGGKLDIRRSFGSDSAPGITGSIRFVVSEWNAETSLPKDLVTKDK